MEGIMSKLIKGMINELLINKGKEIDKTILENIDTITTFDPRVLQANCLTSLFMLDVDKNPKDGFIRYCDDQENYSDKNKRVAILADAVELKHDFDDKEFKKRNSDSTTIEKFIDAIESNQDGFKTKYGNTLFVKALKKVSKQAPNSHFAVQLLSAITSAKLQAQDAGDYEKLNEIENDCKPFVYQALKEKNPFKKQKDIQQAVLGTFNGEERYEASEYYRCLNIHNIIKTKLASENQLNTNVADTNANNSLFYIGLDGFQRVLINANDPDVAGKTVASDGFTMQGDEKITDIVKKCALIDDNLQPTRNSKYIQKALLMINDKVNEFNGQTQRSKKSIQSKENFLQSAIAFLILLDVEEVRDDFDPIGIALANSISDILSMMKGSKELDTLIMNGYKIANRIARAELGQSLNERYFKQITAGETKAKTENENPETQGEPAEATDDSEEKIEKQPETEDTIIVEDDSKGQDDTKQGSDSKASTRKVVGTPVKKAASYVKTNIQFYKNITKSLVAALSKPQAELKKLEAKQKEYDDAKAAGQKAKKLTKAQADKLETLQLQYGSADALSSMIDELKAMNSDMSFLADTMVKAIKKDEELSLDKVKQSMFLSEEQYQKNVARIESYTEYYEFIKAFDNARKVTMADIYTYRDAHMGSTTFSKILAHLPAQKAKQVVPQVQPAKSQTPAAEEEQKVDDPETHN